ncbi:MAG: ABC transporter ATP-binding protein [Tepidanaerobacteraceae bacterium]|nr:ABC transporter ATP-binding protein [Tepidanaerobacteraceae bacterium]
MSDNLVEVKNLKTYFYTEDGIVPAVDGVDFQIQKGETLGIVGESGCGKSVTSLSLLRLVPNPPGKIVDGEIFFRGENILNKTESEMRKIRGNDISMIFQEPMTSLNPVFTIGEQIAEAIELHQGLSKKEAIDKTIEMLNLVGIPSAEKRVNDFPHQMSGGMRQRIMIAMALSCNPSLLIADEPTTALDVTIQAQILELMKDLKERLGTAIMLITHDLGVIAEMAENVMVMYAGKVVEYADVRTVFKEPKHPYTIGLMGSIPRLDQPKEKLYVIEGTVPNPFDMPKGCRFHPRCPEAKEICSNREPELVVTNGHQVRCWKYSSNWKGGGN